MIDKPAPVKEKEITSLDVPNFASGMILNGAQNGLLNSFIDSKDVALTPDGSLVPRPVLQPFLPDTKDIVYQIYPVIWNGVVYYVTLDAITEGATPGEVVYCQEGSTTWAVAGATGSGVTNSFTVNNGGRPKFLRVLDNIFILNGANGDKLAYVSIGTWLVNKYTALADPATAPSASGISTGSFDIYYAYTYTTDTGETNLSPILTQSITTVRDQWQTQSTPLKLTIVKPGTAPAGAQFWSLYIGLSSTGGTITGDDMFPIATAIDLNNTTFVDDGSLSINLGSPAPTANTTDAPKLTNGITEEGNPILFGDIDNPQNIWIGGGGQNAMSFATALNGYLAQPNIGTNFQVTAIIGFRNGQGQPSLTVLFSNTQGLAEQAVLSQQNVTYGSQSFTVWGTTSQHYGAAGVASPDSAINYNGKLLFMSTDGLMSMNTQPLRQNVISTDNLSIKTINAYISQIKNSAMNTVIGTAWDDRYMWTMPSNGFDTPQQILVMDDNNQVQQNNNNGAFYTYDIPAQWIDVVSPQNESAFIYVVQGNKSYKLVQGSATFDSIGGVPTPFSTSCTGPLIPLSPGRNTWQADVQTMFYVVGLVGSITVGVTYRNQSGKLKTKTKTVNGPAYIPTKTGGWGDTGWTYGFAPAVPGWGKEPTISSTAVAVVPQDIRIPVQVDDIMNEAQWFYSTDAGFNNYKIRVINFEGINLGVKPDLQ